MNVLDIAKEINIAVGLQGNIRFRLQGRLVLKEQSLVLQTLLILIFKILETTGSG